MTIRSGNVPEGRRQAVNGTTAQVKVARNDPWSIATSVRAPR
ncbi:hypothetical protein WBK31_17045 [Nonomuraea sp. N2-4H]